MGGAGGRFVAAGRTRPHAVPAIFLLEILSPHYLFSRRNHIMGRENLVVVRMCQGREVRHWDSLSRLQHVLTGANISLEDLVILQRKQSKQSISSTSITTNK